MEVNGEIIWEQKFFLKVFLVTFWFPEVNLYEHLVLTQERAWVVDMRLDRVSMWLSLPQSTSICMPREVPDTMVTPWEVNTKLSSWAPYPSTFVKGVGAGQLRTKAEELQKI